MGKLAARIKIDVFLCSTAHQTTVLWIVPRVLGFSQGAVTAHLLAITKHKYEHEQQAKKGENNLPKNKLESFLASLAFFYLF